MATKTKEKTYRVLDGAGVITSKGLIAVGVLVQLSDAEAEALEIIRPGCIEVSS